MIGIETHTATVYKLDNSVKEVWGVYLTNVPCNIQPSGDTLSERSTGVFDKQHNLYLDATYSGIREGYRIKIHEDYLGLTNKTFQVVGVADHSVGLIPHYELNLSENMQNL